ncbi:MAG TPA: hypothetical protein VKE69_08800 [Planctomycetota bacterium]|nr:hypothetical protein [Planctomycetota bacterium]
MKILSDFDGVFTDPTAEAASVAAVLDELVGDPALVERVRADVRAHPERHGWRFGGAITSYADEDLYVFHNAVAVAVWSAATPAVLERLRVAGFTDESAFVVHCFLEGTTRFGARGATNVLPEALDAAAALAGRGHELVIASNSDTARIERLLRGAGWKEGSIRLRGGAGKFVLGDEPASVPEIAKFGPREIRLRRPRYFALLEEERPDVVIGDVLALDLALPWFLKRSRCVLKRSAATPAWSVGACERAGIERVDSISELPRLLGRA